MRIFPKSAAYQLEFDKVKALLSQYCRSDYSKEKAAGIPLQTDVEIIELLLRQANEYKSILSTSQFFPNEPILNLQRELKLLSIPGSVLNSTELTEIRKLVEVSRNIFRWFDNERKIAYSSLYSVLEGSRYEKRIAELIDEVIDERGQIRDNASPELARIRISLERKRIELRRVFERIIGKLNKQGYLADIEESFLNGRRVVAVFAEQKRLVKGILHGESESRRTAFVEPEETIELNNDLFSLENDERKEIYRILKELTLQLSNYSQVLSRYHQISGEFDFIQARARLAIDMNAGIPALSEKSCIHLVKAYHPLLLIYNKRSGKRTVPVSVELNEKDRILVISGPNAGGKTVTLKTVGLLQLMIQAGLLVPADPSSVFGIFKQLMIHIGDTQSLEFELSTYSSQLINLKNFIEIANGRSLFFIDELGSGSDPGMGGAFAEVILQEMLRKHAVGIVTTHYLNLKVMANKTEGIINGAMAFDEKNLLPEYRLHIGKPGSSYTFAIAERIGLSKELIERARSLVADEHFQLDNLLNKTEADLRTIEEKKQKLNELIRDNEILKQKMTDAVQREKHSQQVELLKQQNKIAEDKIVYLKEMERKLKQAIIDWKKEKDKTKVIRNIEGLLFKRNESRASGKMKKKIDSAFVELPEEKIKVGDKVKMKKNHQVGEVMELRGKKAIVRIGQLPMQLEMGELIVVRPRP